MPLEDPWITEPNDAQFEASGYPCALRRHPGLGHWCGYVGVAESHPWFGLAYRARVTPVHDTLGRTVGAIDLFLEATLPVREVGTVALTLAVHVHGGVTYAEREFPVDPVPMPAAWWFGFDCGHAGDVVPGLPELTHLVPGAAYRDLDYTTGEVMRLAAQLRLVESRGIR